MSRIPIVVFTADDGNWTDYTNLYWEFRKRGLFATSYINAGVVNNYNIEKARWYAWRAIAQKGWDVQCHGYTHTPLSGQDMATVESEIVNNTLDIDYSGLPAPTHHCFPNGLIPYDQNALNKVLEFRKTARQIGPIAGVAQTNTYEEVLEGYIHGISIDIKAGDPNNRLPLAKQKVDEAFENNDVLVFYVHSILKDGEIDPYGTVTGLLSYLQEVLDYVINKGIRIMTISEMYHYVQQELTQ